MEEAADELFKLDQIDRKVLFHLMNNESEAVINSWLSYIATEYYQRRQVSIDIAALMTQVRASMIKK